LLSAFVGVVANKTTYYFIGPFGFISQKFVALLIRM
jgi:hypothetical protein